ncbi:MAG: hypothetical protein IPK10_00725 [Bacteroidetes bacterium]|nr:hypothetical protein [Bacteroidota bacterium]
MKKSLLIISALIAGVSLQLNAQRYVSEIFPDAAITSNIQYATNMQVLTGTPTLVPLRMDVYTPSGAVDPLAQRPLIIIMHTGSFLPPVINGQPTGSKTDSTLVAMCSQFAKRGYVAAAMSYRLGWNPSATGTTAQDIRTGTLLQAVYRGLQDAKACVRYFRATADTGGNPYGIDPNKIILCGVGTGGYIALAYSTLDDPAEIALPKFIANTTDATYGFTAGLPYVNQAVLGDYEGYGGIPQLNNPNNAPGYPSNVQFVFNMGGALGDTSWTEPGDAPTVAFHVVGDPFAPYAVGNVIVPTTGNFVVQVGGSREAVRKANEFGNNNCFASAGFTDALTTYANTVNEGFEGLYPFYTNPAQQAGPWEWYDSTATVAYASNLPPPYNGAGQTVYNNSILTNPDMSKAKALAYIDTVMGYMNPRIVYCLNLSTGLNENPISSAGISFLPNPANDRTTISTSKKELIRAITVFDVLGKQVYFQDQIDQVAVVLERNNLESEYILFV